MKKLLIAFAFLLVAGGAAWAANTRHDLSKYLLNYFQWSLSGKGADHEGNVVFMPIPAGEGPDADGIFHGAASVTLKKNESFYLPMFVFWGETYNNGTAADIPSMIPASAFLDADVHLTLDGAPVIDSDDEDLDPYFTDTTWFKHPVVYPEPTDYHSDSAIWIKALSMLHEPLSKGEHTLELTITSDWLTDTYGFSGWSNTWNITVKK